jgi:hypothetical protein
MLHKFDARNMSANMKNLRTTHSLRDFKAINQNFNHIGTIGVAIKLLQRNSSKNGKMLRKFDDRNMSANMKNLQ